MKSMMQPVVVALALALALTGCGGGSGSLPQSPGTPSPAPHGSGTLSISITVPKKAAGSALRPHYVSPSTQSATIAITGPTNLNPPPINLTPSSPNCVTGLAGLICTIQVTLQPGAYLGTMTTFDGLNGTGRELSTAQAAAFTIVAGIVNAIAITMSGVPRAISIAPVSTLNTVANGGGFALIGTLAHGFVVQALDADSNLILGPGAPTFSVTQTGGTFTPALGQPRGSAPNEFTVTPPATWAVGGNATLGVTASFAGQGTDGCSQPSAVCTASLVVAPRELMAVTDSGAHTAHIYDVTSGTPVPLIVLTGIGGGTPIARFDPNGNFFANIGAGVIDKFAPPSYTSSSSIGGFVGTTIYDFVASPNGNALWVGQSGGTAAVTPVTISTDTLGTPITLEAQAALSMSNDGLTVFGADQLSDVIKLIDTNTRSLLTPIPATGCTPFGLHTSFDSQRLFVNCLASHTVAVYMLVAGTWAAQIPVALSPGFAPFGLAYDLTTHDICTVNEAANTVAIFHDNGDGTTSIPITVTVGTTPFFSATDASGNCYVTNSADGTISEFNLASPPSAASVAASGLTTPDHIDILP